MRIRRATTLRRDSRPRRKPGAKKPAAPREFPLPDLGRITAKRRIKVTTACQYLGVSERELREEKEPDLQQETAKRQKWETARQVMEGGDPFAIEEKLRQVVATDIASRWRTPGIRVRFGGFENELLVIESNDDPRMSFESVRPPESEREPPPPDR